MLIPLLLAALLQAAPLAAPGNSHHASTSKPAAGQDASPVKDLLGWKDIRWEMSVERLKKLHPELTIGPDEHGFTVGVLPNVRIGDSEFRVHLGFRGVGGNRIPGDDRPELQQSEWRLKRIDLKGFVTACDRANTVLLGKYGPPAKRQYGLDSWVFPTTTIVAGVAGGECIVAYLPSDKGDNV
jgi:hypothetical protein